MKNKKLFSNIYVIITVLITVIAIASFGAVVAFAQDSSSLAQPFDEGFVSLTFDDGFSSQYQNALPELISSSIKSTFYVVSHAISGLSIKNSSLEESDVNGPVGWSKTDSIDATYDYPVAGHNGDRGAKVTSSKIDSNAGWYFIPVVVINDSIYSFSEWYKSNTDSELVALVTKKDGTTIEADVTDIAGNTLSATVNLASSMDNWTKVDAFFYIPLDAKNVTVINRLKGVGDLTIDDVSFGDSNYMNLDQIKSLLSGGQEVGGHTQSHQDLTTLSLTDAQIEIEGGRQDLLLNDISPIVSFDYPYGNNNQDIKQIVQNSGFTSARGIVPGFNEKNTDKYALFSQSVNADTSLNTIESWINQAVNDHTWLILVFHNIQSDLTNTPFGFTPSNLQLVIDYLKNNNITTLTINDGISLMTNVTDPVSIPTLASISITTPANKLSYTVGDTLDISGLVVTGTYSDNSTKTESISASNISGFDSSIPVAEQILTITIGEKTTTYTISINAISVNNNSVSPSEPDHKRNNSFPIVRLIKKDAGRVLGVEKFRFEKDLRLRMKNDSVKELQTRFKKEGLYSGPVTGYFGTTTLKIVKKYQAKNGLPNTGFVGSLTRNLLNNPIETEG